MHHGESPQRVASRRLAGSRQPESGSGLRRELVRAICVAARLRGRLDYPKIKRTAAC